MSNRFFKFDTHPAKIENDTLLCHTNDETQFSLQADFKRSNLNSRRKFDNVIK